jgi:cytochrome c peroxidase
MKKITFLLGFSGALLFLASCDSKSDFNYYYYTPEETATLNKYLNLPELPDDYTVAFPSHLRNTGLFARPVERDKAILGRVLFYDKNLSSDGTISCASCHKQELGFGDDKKVSTGVEDRQGERNAIALSSVANFSAYYGTDLNGSSAIRFFWDNRAETASDQSRGSLTDHQEMNMKMSDVVTAVQSQPYYVPLLKKAFGDDQVTETRVLESLANFVNAMGSYQSRFDEVASASGASFQTYGTNWGGFSSAENAGKKLYMDNCASCHSSNFGRPVLFNANNGLDATTSDPGVGAITGKNTENGTFKVPTLRNIAISAPYMHDGRFSTLEEVVNFYSTGIQAHPNLHADLRTGPSTPKRMNFSETDKSNLIAFLNTLTDSHFKTDSRFSNPFKQ